MVLIMYFHFLAAPQPKLRDILNLQQEKSMRERSTLHRSQSDCFTGKLSPVKLHRNQTRISHYTIYFQISTLLAIVHNLIKEMTTKTHFKSEIKEQTITEQDRSSSEL